VNLHSFNRRSQQGFSLIELLVSVVVFSVGLLAIAGLQTVSKRASFEGLQRTTAAQVAYGLLEDMRTNGDAIAVYVGAGELGGGTRGAEPAPNCRGGAVCNSIQKAAYDLWFWESVLDGDMEMNANGSAGGIVAPTICVNGPLAGGAGVYAVTVAWYGTNAISNPAFNNCGAGSGKYGAANEYRRVLQVPTFIDPNI